MSFFSQPSLLAPHRPLKGMLVTRASSEQKNPLPQMCSYLWDTTVDSTVEPQTPMNRKNTIGILATGWLACLPLLAAAPPASSNALFEAIRTGDRAQVKALLKNGAD